MFKVFIFIAAVLAAVFVAPMAASAVPYTPGAQVHASRITLKPGETVRVYTDPGFFTADETVGVSVSGVDAAGVSYPSAVTSDSAGATSFLVTVPKDASGPYTVTLTSGSASGSVTVNVLSGASSSNPTNPGSSSGSSGSGLAAGAGLGIAGLAFTGGQFPGLLIWATAGLIGLGVSLLVVRSVKRRERVTT